MVVLRRAAVAAMSAGLITIGAAGAYSMQSTPAPSAPGSDLLEPGRCYRFAFPIEGPPHYKVLELLDRGWIRAEVDAGSASARREPVWINTAQIITIRHVRCSE